MRISSFFAMFLLLDLLPAAAQTDAVAVAPLADRGYKILRENEDWSFLRNAALRDDFWDPIKYVPFGGKDDSRYLTIGGEMREVWEQIGNDNWGQQAYTNGHFLERYMVHFDVRFGKHFRSFVQLKNGVDSLRVGGPRPIDEKKLDFEAAYVEVGTGGAHDQITLRVGRQELNYGSGRLLSVREGPNVRQSFDGLKIRSNIGAWSIDGFTVRPDLDKPGYFNNAPDHKTLFWGAYSTRPVSKTIHVDFYYLGLDRKRATFQRGTAREVRQSVGARVSRSAPKSGGLDFDYEAVGQFGTFGTGNIRAWTMASDTGYSFADMPLKPRFSMKADISSGDNSNGRSLGTFNPVFPIGNYFGVIASTGPGPVNFIDIHPRVQTQLRHGVTISADWVVQWRESVFDGVYAVPGFLIRPSGASTARFVGHRPGLEIRWQVDRHLYFQADYGVFYAGKFLKETMPGRNLNYWALWAGYKF